MLGSLICYRERETYMSDENLQKLCWMHHSVVFVTWKQLNWLCHMQLTEVNSHLKVWYPRSMLLHSKMNKMYLHPNYSNYSQYFFYLMVSTYHCHNTESHAHWYNQKFGLIIALKNKNKQIKTCFILNYLLNINNLVR